MRRRDRWRFRTGHVTYTTIFRNATEEVFVQLDGLREGWVWGIDTGNPALDGRVRITDTEQTVAPTLGKRR